MDTQVERVNAWREQKRRDGYQPMTIWIKAKVKHTIEDLASQRRQDLGEVVTAAVEALTGGKAPAAETVRTVRELVAESLAALAPGLLSPGPPTPLPPTDALLPGERGAQTQAIRAAAVQLGRFTCAAMAKQVGSKSNNIIKTLSHLVDQGELVKEGPVYFVVSDAAPPPSATLLPGEPGALTQAIRTAAPKLGRFTCATMAKVVGAKPNTVRGALARLVTQGVLAKKGLAYFWVSPQTP
jgi:hypothetical protein